MAKIHLTKTIIQSLTPPETGKVRYFDESTPGFGVYITASGAKSFFICYRTKGRLRFQTIGPFGAWTIATARKEALEIVVKVGKGQDPLSEKHAQREGITVIEFWEKEFFGDAHKRWKETTEAMNLRRWKLFISAPLGKKRLDTVTRKDIDTLHRKMKKTPIEANRTLALLKGIFNKAIEWEFLESNPAKLVKAYPEKARERYLTAEEFKKLMAAIDEEEMLFLSPEKRPTGVKREKGDPKEQRGVSQQAAGLFRLLTFTGARLGEILSARWDYLDWKRAALDLPDSKTGKKTIWLNLQALEELKRLWDIKQHDEWIIESYIRPTKHLVSPQKAWGRVRERAELSKLRMHDLRHSFASVAIMEGGANLALVGKALGHTQARTTERYAHIAENPVKELAERVGEAIEAAIGGAEIQDIGKLKKDDKKNLSENKDQPFSQ